MSTSRILIRNENASAPSMTSINDANMIAAKNDQSHLENNEPQYHDFNNENTYNDNNKHNKNNMDNNEKYDNNNEKKIMTARIMKKMTKKNTHYHITFQH